MRQRPSITNIIAVLLALYVGATCYGCTPVVPANIPVRPFESRPLIPEAWYRDLFDKLSVCLGDLVRHPALKFDALHFYVAGPFGIETWTPTDGFHVAAGLWSNPLNIYLDRRFVISPPVVAHEMGHALTGLGDELHAHPRFIACVG